MSSLGLAAACTPANTPPVDPEPGPASEPDVGVEPSGRGLAAKPATPASPPLPEPHFEGVPTAFCQATLQARAQSLLRTASFLEVWNELAPDIRNPLAHNIPSTEIDARVYVCGSEQCTVDAARLAEVAADYLVGVGVLIPDQGELLVVPEIANPHHLGPCTAETTVEVERHGSFIHIHALSHDRRYNYGHGYGHGYAYDPVPLECRIYSTIWRDLVIDASTGELELIIDQVKAEDLADPPVTLSVEEPGIVLRGCGSALELQWTE